MKYFTPQLYLRLNSEDYDEVDKAREEWEAAIAKYTPELDSLPPSLQPLKLSFHDSTLVDVQPADGVQLIVRLYGEIKPTVIKYHDAILLRREKIEGWRFGQSPDIEILYDEIEDAEPPTHNILLSNGEELSIQFSRCEVSSPPKSNLVGKRAVFSVRYVDQDEQLVERKQDVGVVMNVGPDGIHLRMDDGSAFSLPPDESAFLPAPQGAIYTLKDGRVIERPDYEVVYTVTPPADEE